MQDDDFPKPPAFDSARHRQMQQRNRVLGLALGAFVIILGIVSYFRVGALMP